MDALKAHDVDALVCKGVGRRAFAALREADIEVLTPAPETVEEIVEEVGEGRARRLSANEACNGRHADGRRSGAGLGGRHCRGHDHGRDAESGGGHPHRSSKE
jgi:predicted Fe-Mo cluster-binding NifX family protein